MNLKSILYFLIFFQCSFISAQIQIDTLAFQDFEVSPQAPVWSFTGPVIYNSGFSGVNAAPANSPIGIGGSRAWETTSNSGGLLLEFNNTVIPAGYDSIRVQFDLAAMNLLSTGGGPDNLDYVLVAYSLDNGTTYSNRLRVRGATVDNSYWPYSATGIATAYYLPATEALFQPITSGPQTTMGYSTCEIVFPGQISQLKVMVTGRSSSSTDSWLIDNLLMTGETLCPVTYSTTTITECNSYTWTNGTTYNTSGTYTQTLVNSNGCDSIATLELAINNPSTGTDIQTACDSYTWIDNVTYSSSTNTPTYTLQNAAGCDSVVTLNLTINNSSASTTTITACNEYTWTNGNTYTSSGTHTQTLTNANGCDSVATLELTINNPTSSTFSASSCGPYFWELAQATYSFPGSFPFTVTGSNGCDSVVTLSLFLGFVPTAEITHDGNGNLNATGGMVIAWIDCATNTVIQGESGSTFTPATNGSYRVVISDGVSSCEDTSACFVLNNVNINTQQLVELSIYPNPTNNLVIISFDGTNAHYTVYDAQGKLIQTSNIQSGGTVSLRDVQSGVYFFELITEEGKTVKRVVKN